MNARPIPAGTTVRSSSSLNVSRTNSAATTRPAVQTTMQSQTRSTVNVRPNSQVSTTRPNSSKAPVTTSAKRQAPVKATSTFNMTMQTQTQPQIQAARRTGQPINASPQRNNLRQNVGGSMTTLTPSNYNGVVNSPSRTHTVQGNGYLHMPPNAQFATMTPVSSGPVAFNPTTVTRQQGPSSFLTSGAVRTLTFDPETDAEFMDVNANRVPVPMLLQSQMQPEMRVGAEVMPAVRRSGIPMKSSMIPNMRPAAPVPQGQFQPIGDDDDDFY